ncbi:dipeptide/oligopeptide transport system, inner membrane permease component [Desulforapulum autotrophicum HRM2]|uniref:Dipeptide/oligopeptide transport system, inner membrane permease component n=1 Tax=Desulforapulum autotrophicum (strain ATCC 43914 / DSM 3382 / VKM B-1955 / HRM2) TaxID=177437 RepID=C0QI87_DESAH|nr:ABC transporter permease subunit [Desulforapulum autotrophicum]ACN15823.1 dipeptide/oligopeptide transport system, inner membrane permease component [Desulforapulum autotrophicum HRM2]
MIISPSRKKWRRFVSIRRGYVSFILLTVMVVFSLFAELFINSRALVVSYEGELFFPTYGPMISGTVFGLDYGYETDYRKLQTAFKAQENGENWVLMPMVPFNAYENDLKEGSYPPFPPSFAQRHFLGTDNVGRDILARLVYGFRTALGFSVILLVFNYSVGIFLGCAMGYFGGKFDLFAQRILEVWSNIPFLYVVIIVSSIVVPSFMVLLLIMAFFGWIQMTWVMRTMTYREKEREYVLAARSLGASHARIIFHHIIPNTISVIVTYAPFAISGGIVALTSLDYLGFGLPAPTPSWGELLQQGWTNMEAWWISASVVAALVITLMTVTFTGEGIREALDPRMHTTYE